MTFENFVRSLNAFARRRPFTAFLIQFTSGESVRISHPEAIRMYGTTFLWVEPDSRFRLFDADGVCQLIEAPMASSTKEDRE